MKRSLSVLISASSLCLLAACGSGSPPPATHFSVTAPATATAGTTFSFTVTALDASNRATTNYSGTAHVTSTDGQATLPPNAVLKNGMGTFSATLKTAGSQTITATDTVTASITGSFSIGVGPGPATRYSITVPSNAIADKAFDIMVAALDAFNNIATAYSGTIQFTSTDPHADLPPASPLPNGSDSFKVGLKTIGAQTVTATDTVTASLTSTSNPVDVTAIAAANPVPFINQPLSPDAIAPGGGSFTLAVNGTGFVTGSVVKWNGQALATQFVSQSKLTATVLAGDVASFNTGAVTVFSPAPAGGTSNVVYFETTRATSAIAYNAPSLAGLSPFAVATGDFNGDGKLDLAVAYFNSGGAVSILLGNGDGTFQSAANYAVGSGSSSVAMGDFNGDGKLDLAVANSGENTVSILLGNGDGTFQSAVDYVVGSGPSSVAVGDFNSDGKLDVAVSNLGFSNTAPGSISLLLGNGDGTFQSAMNFAVGSGPTSAAVGDFNGDGKLDLAVANPPENTVSVLLGNGDGTFQPVLDYPAGNAPQSVAVGDFNGDGKLDLAVANPPENTVSILLGHGDGTFQSAANYEGGSGPSSVAVGDFNGDNRLDLVVIGNSGGDVSVLLGNGDGTFQAAVNFDHFDLPAGPTSVAVGDFDASGRFGIAAAGYTNVFVLLQPPLVSGPDAILSGTNLTFPAEIVGNTSPEQSVMLINYGSDPLMISSITPSANFGESENCGSALAAGGGCTVNVTSTPGAAGILNGTLSINDNGPGSPQMVSLSGIGARATTATLTPSTMGFECGFRQSPMWSCSSPEMATLTNTGTSTLYIQAITIDPENNFSQTNNCPTSLFVGQSCAITVSFYVRQPFRTTGTVNFSTVLSVNDNATGSPQQASLEGAAQ